MDKVGFPTLTLTLRHKSPLALADFTEAMDRFSTRYARYARQHGAPEDARLYIADIREGSTVIDLFAGGAAAHAAMSAIGDMNTLFSYGKNLAFLLNLFLQRKEKAAELSISDCDDVRAIVKPAIHAEGGGINIVISGDNNIVAPVLLDLNREDAQTIDNRAAILRHELGRTEHSHSSQVVLVWNQVRDVPGVEEGQPSHDRAIISDIDPRALPVRFEQPEIKDQMIHGDVFAQGYLVDVKTLNTPKGIVGYLVTRFHDVIPIDKAG